MKTLIAWITRILDDGLCNLGFHRCKDNYWNKKNYCDNCNQEIKKL